MLKQEINEQMKQAMRSKDKERLNAIRLITSAIKQKEVDERIEITDQDVLAILEKMLKQRKDSISQFQAAGRDDLIEKENFEIEVIKTFMPAQLTSEEVSSEVKSVIVALNASSVKDMGKVMAELKSKLQGKADMSEISKLVKTFLS